MTNTRTFTARNIQTSPKTPLQELFPAKPGFDLSVVEVRQNQGGYYRDGEAHTVDDGSSESGKMREYECVDIDDDGEMDQERTSAPIAQKDYELIGQNLGKNAFFLGEDKGKQHRNKSCDRCMGIENIGIAHGPDKYKIRTGKDKRYLKDIIKSLGKVHITLFLYSKQKCEDYSRKHIKDAVKGEAMG